MFPPKIIALDSPDKVSLVWSTDWHLSEYAPGRRRDDYCQAILNKLIFISNLAQKTQAVCLCGGDVFHYKHPKHPANSLSLIIRILHVLRTFPKGRVFGAPGNHDLYFDRMDSLSTQPLGLLIATGAFHDLNKEPVLFTPKDGSFGVLVETFGYENNGEKTLAKILNAPPRPAEATYRVGIVHQYGAPGNRGDLWGTPIIGYNELAGCDYDFLLWGHDHSRKETITVGNTTHINLGSLARAALPTDEDGHPIVASVLGFTKDGAYRPKEVSIPVTPLEAAFQTADKGMEAISDSDEVAEFFQSVDEAVAGVEEGADANAVLKKLCEEDPSLLNLVLELCQL